MPHDQEYVYGFSPITPTEQICITILEMTTPEHVLCYTVGLRIEDEELPRGSA